MKYARYKNDFTPFAVVAENGKLTMDLPQKEYYQKQIEKTGRTVEEQWQYELFGKGMFQNRTRGACTSSAIYLQTCLRAIGIPTRTVLCVPIVDASDENEALLVKNLTHHGIRDRIQKSIQIRKNSWSSHTFNEVYVGNRWYRLNYHKLGDNILSKSFGAVRSR